MSAHNESYEQTIAKKVMRQIESGKVTMRPHWQFALMAILSAIGLITAAAVVVYLTNLVTFKLRLASIDRPMYGLRANIDYFTGNFPWLAFALSIVSISIFIWLMRKFDFSYRIGRWLFVAVVMTSLGIGIVLAFTSLNNHLETFGPMRGIYGHPMQGNREQGDGMGSPQHNNGNMGPSPQNDNGMMQRHGQQSQ